MEWIKSKDQLPDNNESVLCFNGHRMVENSYSIGSDQDIEWFKRVFTHWCRVYKPNDKSEKQCQYPDDCQWPLGCSKKCL